MPVVPRLLLILAIAAALLVPARAQAGPDDKAQAGPDDTAQAGPDDVAQAGPDEGADVADHAMRVDREQPAVVTGPHAGHRSARRADLDPFVMIGVRLPASPDPADHVEIRLHDDAGWDAWMELPGSHGPDAGTGEGETDPAHVSEPIWVGEADGYELSLPAGLRTDGLEVLLVRETDEVVAVEPGMAEPTTAAGRASDAPTIRSRASWGAAPYRDGAPEIADHLQFGLVHHSVSTNDYSAAQVPGIIRAIQAFHQDGNGWHDIAYNFVADRFGTIWEGRAGGIDRAIIGGHAKGFNTGSTAVVALGEFGASSPPTIMQDRIGELLGWKLFVHGVDPDGRFDFASYGNELYDRGEIVNLPRLGAHRDTALTACPGNLLYAYLGVIRAGAIEAYDARVGAGTFSTRSVAVTGTYTPLHGDFDGDSDTDILWYGPGAAKDGLWWSDGDGTFTAVPLTVSGTYVPLVADFDGDWRTDIFWYGPGDAKDSLWLARDRGFSSRPVTVGGTYSPVVGEFTGDDAQDIIWYGPGAARDSFWQGSTKGRFQPRPLSIGGTYGPIVGDFDGDWRDDVFWYGPGAAPDSIWLGRSKGTFAPRPTAVSGAYEPSVLDVDGDLHDDILWSGADNDSIWLGADNGTFGVAAVDQAIDGTTAIPGDFTGGGLDDIVWYDPGGDHDSLWRSVGPAQFSKKSLDLDGPYIPIRGDFDDDGRQDILWYGPGAATDRLWLGDG